MNECVLVVDDDREIVQAIALLLEKEGYRVLRAYDGMEALEQAMDRSVRLMIIDVMMPRLDGLSAVMKLRERRNLPIIVLSAKSEDTDKVLGLSMGADDYVTKPFGVMELLSRVRAVLRRAGPGEEPAPLLYGEVSLDPGRRAVTAAGEPVALTYKEFELLAFLLKNQGLVLTREKIMERVWGFDYEGESRTVDMHIKSLRHKLGACGEIIRTVRGVGYKIGE